MIIYAGTKTDFLNSVVEDRIAQEIEENIYYKMRRHPGAGEFRAWENSLQYMYKVLSDEDIPDNSGIAIEYDYPIFHLSMDCFWCEVTRGELILKEAAAARWLTPAEMYSVKWLPADLILVDQIVQRMGK